MDSKFLEFYGQSLLNAAKGKKQFEQFRDMMQPFAPGTVLGPDFGFKGLKAVEELFRKCYGMGDFNDQPQDDENRKKAMEEMMTSFQASFSGYARQMGWIPVNEYEALKNRVEDLEKKIEKQQGVIDGFHQILGLRNPTGYREFFGQMEKIGQKQNRQFKEFVQSFFDVFDTPGNAPD